MLRAVHGGVSGRGRGKGGGGNTQRWTEVDAGKGKGAIRRSESEDAIGDLSVVGPSQGESELVRESTRVLLHASTKYLSSLLPYDKSTLTPRKRTVY